MNKLEKILFGTAITGLLGLIAFVCLSSPDGKTYRFLQPGVTYTVTDGKDGILTCVSDRHDVWMHKNVQVTALMNWERLPLQVGDRFTVSEQIWDYSEQVRDYIHKL